MATLERVRGFVSTLELPNRNGQLCLPEYMGKIKHLAAGSSYESHLLAPLKTIQAVYVAAVASLYYLSEAGLQFVACALQNDRTNLFLHPYTELTHAAQCVKVVITLSLVAVAGAFAPTVIFPMLPDTPSDFQLLSTLKDNLLEGHAKSQASLREVTQQKEALQAQLDALQRSTVLSAKDEEKTRLTQRVQELEKQVEQLRGQLTNLQRQQEENRRALDEKAGALEQMSSMHQAVSETLRDKETQLVTQRSQFAEVVQEKTLIIGRLEEQIALLEQERAQLDKVNQAQLQELQAQETKFRKLTEMKDLDDGALADATLDAEKQRKKVAGLEEENHSLQEQFEQAASSAQQFKVELADAKDQFERQSREQQRRIQALEAQLKTASDSLQKLRDGAIYRTVNHMMAVDSETAIDRLKMQHAEEVAELKLQIEELKRNQNVTVRKGLRSGATGSENLLL